jgi:hypothetical protein
MSNLSNVNCHVSDKEFIFSLSLMLMPLAFQKEMAFWLNATYFLRILGMLEFGMIFITRMNERAHWESL